jgi:hypothetical protein
MTRESTTLAAVIVYTYGCGAATGLLVDGGTASSGGESSDGEPSQDAGLTSGGPCPASPPSPGSACGVLGNDCEYGPSANLACNSVFECSPSGWSQQSFGSCPVATCPTEVPPSSGECPATGLVCSYGSTGCNCVLGPSGAGSPSWFCYQAPAGCPATRPHLGTPCEDSGQSCTYGDCYGVFLVCSAGSWQVSQVTCL